MDDHYTTLGVSRNATEQEIRDAYRRMAAKYHPDRNKDPGAEEKFKNIQVAYSILNDAQRKDAYDNPQPGAGFWGNGGHQNQPGWQNMDHMNINDMFQHFFNHRPADPFDLFGQRPQRNRTINLSTQITLLDAFTGKDLVADVTMPSGRTQTINVKIPAGIHDGTVMRLSGIGDDEIPHLPRGDIHLTVTVLPHHEFTRQGDDLVKQLNVSAIEAMLGCKADVITIDGKTLEVKINPGIQNDQVLSAQGYGMPNMNDNRFRGRLLMPVKIVIPTNLTQKQIDLLNQFHKP
jgi:curved DNA-binding protein